MDSEIGKLLIPTAIGIGGTLLARHIYDRWSRPEQIERASQQDDKDLRTWMEGHLKDLRIWMEGQFTEGRRQFAKHDERIRGVEIEVASQQRADKERHKSKRAGDPPGLWQRAPGNGREVGEEGQG